MGDEWNSRPLDKPMTSEATSQEPAPWHFPAGSELELDPLFISRLPEKEEDILFQYEAVTWPVSLSFRQILQSAPLPSPFSLSLSDWLNGIVGDPLGGINELYDSILLDYDTLLNGFTLSSPSFSHGGRVSGFVCWRENAAPYGMENEGYTPGTILGGWVQGLGLSSFEL